MPRDGARPGAGRPKGRLSRRHIRPAELHLVRITPLAAVAQFERSLISERIKDAKRNLRRGNKHQGGKRPFGWQFGEANGHGRARELVPDAAEQKAIAEMTAMRADGASLMAIRDAVRAQGHQISHRASRTYWRAARRRKVRHERPF